MEAVLIDYIGTLLRYDSTDLTDMTNSFVQHSKVKDADQFDAWWSDRRMALEEACRDETFRTEEDICRDILAEAQNTFNLKADLDALYQLNQSYWMYGEFFSDAEPFLHKCSLPCFIITNFGTKYVKVALKRKNLHVHAIYSSDDAKVHKPHADFYRYVLEQTGLKPEDTVMIASRPGDLEGAAECGIQGILVDRNGDYDKGNYYKVRNLEEAARFLQ